MLFLFRNIVRSLPLASRRTFCSTPHLRAVQEREVFFRAFQNTTIFQKLAGHPEAVAALEDFAKLLQVKGVDISSGKPPSTMQMIKLAANADFRESAKRVGEELKKAGVNFQSKELMQEMMDLMKLKDSSSGSSDPK